MEVGGEDIVGINVWVWFVGVRCGFWGLAGNYVGEGSWSGIRRFCLILR